MLGEVRVVGFTLFTVITVRNRHSKKAFLSPWKKGVGCGERKESKKEGDRSS